MKNRIEVDIHTHTLASGHAYGTVRENALAASERGLLGLGMSEHAPGHPGTCDPIYFRVIHAVPRELYGVHIYYGVENNLLPDGTMSLPEDVLRRLDYGIVGIHGVCYEDQGTAKNTDNLIRCMKDPKTFFVSHPDDGTWPLDSERVVLAAKELGVALEVNNADVRGGWKKNCIGNIRTFLDLCMRYRANVYVGSDAHDPSQVGRVEKALEFLDSVGFPESLVLNLDAAALMDHISK